MQSQNQNNQPNIDERLLKPYEPNNTESKIYKVWEESGLFNPDVCIKNGVTKADAPVFSMVLPPPNVTGTLHMGHALMLTIEDIMVRFNRMRGKRTLWVPGTDHAAIATQSKVEKIIYKEEGKNRHDLGREEFLNRVKKFAQDSHDTIVNQMKTMGVSVDWSREAYTLDEKRNLAVKTAFKKMYDEGLIYRGHRIVNWDPKGQTTVSDDEVVYEERKAKFYTFKYSKDFPISISTTRPETKVGDTAVAVHPDDPRYKNFVGKEFDANFAGVPIHIKIVADESVDKEFGTGALGVTPAHSIADWDIAERHNLPRPQVINEYAKMMVDTPELKGKKTTEAREIIVEWLKKEGLLEKEEEVSQNISTAERTGGIIEPLPKLQWFLNVNKEFTLVDSKIDGIPSGSDTTLKEIMKKTVENGQINIVPDHFKKTYFHWIENLRDWCISRQIWFGHRIPVWYKEDEIYCGINAPEGEGWVQDPDTLDTWFSSGLWTFSVLGWPEKTEDLKIYHPTNILETGYEILFFWVARMILMTGYILGDIPFKKVYLHGTVRDSQGRKMSKSLGNGIDPIDIAQKYGADAARISLVIGAGPGTDTRIYEDKIKGQKHFANKIWNVTRFILTNVNNDNLGTQPKKYSPENEALLNELKEVVKQATANIENDRLHIAAEEIYQYFWHVFADKIIEDSKEKLNGNNEMGVERRWVIKTILETSLKLIHPFMPFVTEEVWGIVNNHFGNKTKNLIMVSEWPEV
ncbi:MAG: valyl-tRNA synthetase [Parcubacteria group bacterium GW2011_GWF2_38_76]|nr:MAG: valyl-tRNA synthetase [Parcubacteria group bacterium GW2011_GWF2_38_76]HBM45592.1 valine--tRNA ligase [Patescibacteria group bacterium]